MASGRSGHMADPTLEIEPWHLIQVTPPSIFLSGIFSWGCSCLLNFRLRLLLFLLSACPPVEGEGRIVERPANVKHLCRRKADEQNAMLAPGHCSLAHVLEGKHSKSRQDLRSCPCCTKLGNFLILLFVRFSATSGGCLERLYRTGTPKRASLVRRIFCLNRVVFPFPRCYL